MPQGIFTIENTETGEFRTFRNELCSFRDADDNDSHKWVLSYLRGPSNSSDFEGFAFVFGDKIRVWKSKRSQGQGDRSECERFALLLDFIFTGPAAWRERYTVLKSRPCSRCGERLTVPESIRRGVGPICAKR